jgi:hypothetical protein
LTGRDRGYCARLYFIIFTTFTEYQEILADTCRRLLPFRVPSQANVVKLIATIGLSNLFDSINIF